MHSGLTRSSMPTASLVTVHRDDKHAMPAEGRPPLSPRQIAWITAWIQQGASSSATSLAGISMPEGPKDPPLQPVGDYSGLMTEISDMQKGTGAKLESISVRPSDGLILQTVDVAPSFGDL